MPEPQETQCRVCRRAIFPEHGPVCVLCHEPSKPAPRHHESIGEVPAGVLAADVRTDGAPIEPVRPKEGKR